MLDSLDFGSFWYTDQILLNIEDVRIILLKDHDQVMQHGDVPVKNVNRIMIYFNSINPFTLNHKCNFTIITKRKTTAIKPDCFDWKSWTSKKKKKETSSLTSDLSILDLVSTILLRLDTLKPYALPLCPLFMKFPNAKTTSRTCVRRLLLITSRDAHRIAGNEMKKGI